MLKQEKDTETAGGILADDMGLGKTFQTIALMQLNKSEDQARPNTLIIAPRSALVASVRQVRD